MSHPTGEVNFKQNLILSFKILMALGVLILARHTIEGWSGISFQENSLFGFGLLLVAGVFGGQASASLGLPKITGYLGAGLIIGPSASGLLTYTQVDDLKLVNQLALALIALQAGCELTREMLRSNLGVILKGSFYHLVVIGLGMTALLFLMRGQIDFLGELSTTSLFLVLLLFSIIAVSKSPGVVVALLSETKSRGPLSEYALGMVVLLDILVLVLFSAIFVLTQSSLTGMGGFSLAMGWSLLEEILLSVAAGTFFGALIILYLKTINREKLFFLIAISYGVSTLCDFLHYDTLLVFVIAGLMVTQFSKQSEKMIHTIEDLSSVIMVIFFATAGASLHMNELQQIWKLAVFIFIARVSLTVVAEKFTHMGPSSHKSLKSYGSTPFVSQAGLTIGLATILQQNMPGIGMPLATLAIAVVTLNEIFGPVIFKLGLRRAGEIPNGSKDLPIERAPDAEDEAKVT